MVVEERVVSIMDVFGCVAGVGAALVLACLAGCVAVVSATGQTTREADPDVVDCGFVAGCCTAVTGFDVEAGVTVGGAVIFMRVVETGVDNTDDGSVVAAG